MPRFLNWLLRLGPTNPICMRLVWGGSRRSRHLWVRSGYLAVMIIVLVLNLLTSGAGSGGGASLQDLASAGAQSFATTSYLQLILICFLTPIFMAGAIAQEANPRTWDILLTTPLSSLQIVLGNLFGRLFFVIALLVSTLPLFAVTQFFGGVPGQSIFLSYAIAAATALLVGAVAITLSVSRQAGRRAVFLFYITVVLYVGITWSIDRSLRVGGGGLITWMTALNPILALESLLNSQNYGAYSDAALAGRSWAVRWWLGAPVGTYCSLCGVLSVVLAAWSTVTLRIIGTRGGVKGQRFQFLQKLGMRSATRKAREVWKNPVAWREAAARRTTLGQLIARWGFIAVGLAAGVAILLMFHFNVLIGTTAALRRVLLTLLATEVAIIGLTALNISATAISREREDGTLDLLTTTPLTPDLYLSGKLRGIISFLLPMIALPVVTLLLFSGYCLLDGLGNANSVMVTTTNLVSNKTIPFVLPEAALVLPFVLTPFIAFCVIVGLNWSLKSKGTIGSVSAAVGFVLAVTGVLSLCTFQGGTNIQVVGGVLSSLSPVTAVWAGVFPEQAIQKSLNAGAAEFRAARVAMVIGSFIAAAAYAFIVYGMYKTMLGPNGKNFDMSVRKLAGQA